jgi:hypothetical protein
MMCLANESHDVQGSNEMTNALRYHYGRYGILAIARRHPAWLERLVVQPSAGGASVHVMSNWWNGRLLNRSTSPESGRHQDWREETR